MKLWLIFVRADDHTWLEGAWDDEATALNPEGWQKEVDRVRKLATENAYEMRIVSATVRGVHDLFDVPELPAKLEEER